MAGDDPTRYRTSDEDAEMGEKRPIHQLVNTLKTKVYGMKTKKMKLLNVQKLILKQQLKRLITLKNKLLLL